MRQRRLAQPSFEPLEDEARQTGYPIVAGVDEAGRGPLAGPVVAAAVILPVDATIDGVRDSKQLTARQRDRAYDCILREALSVGFGIVSHEYIDQHNILQATLEAMRRAAQELDPSPDLVFVDGTMCFPSSVQQRTLVKGDARCGSVAAASILAKVKRDRLMVDYAKRYPHYGFESHKGYPTREHYQRLQIYGPCAIHRRSFRGVLTPRTDG